jgi:hypothetical protein
MKHISGDKKSPKDQGEVSASTIFQFVVLVVLEICGHLVGFKPGISGETCFLVLMSLDAS